MKKICQKIKDNNKEKENIMKTTKITKYSVESFMTNVNKLDKFVHLQTHSEKFGTVKLLKAAYETKNGKRMFSVKNSPVIKSGSYSLGGLRKKLLAVVH